MSQNSVRKLINQRIVTAHTKGMIPIKIPISEEDFPTWFFTEEDSERIKNLLESQRFFKPTFVDKAEWDTHVTALNIKKNYLEVGFKGYPPLFFKNVSRFVTKRAPNENYHHLVFNAIFNDSEISINLRKYNKGVHPKTKTPYIDLPLHKAKPSLLTKIDENGKQVRPTNKFHEHFLTSSYKDQARRSNPITNKKVAFGQEVKDILLRKARVDKSLEQISEELYSINDPEDKILSNILDFNGDFLEYTKTEKSRASRNTTALKKYLDVIREKDIIQEINKGNWIETGEVRRRMFFRFVKKFYDGMSSPEKRDVTNLKKFLAKRYKKEEREKKLDQICDALSKNAGEGELKAILHFDINKINDALNGKHIHKLFPECTKAYQEKIEREVERIKSFSDVLLSKEIGLVKDQVTMDKILSDIYTKKREGKKSKNRSEFDFTNNQLHIFLHSWAGMEFSTEKLKPEEVKKFKICLLDTEKKYWAVSEKSQNFSTQLTFKDEKGNVYAEYHTTQMTGQGGEIVDFKHEGKKIKTKIIEHLHTKKEEYFLKTLEGRLRDAENETIKDELERRIKYIKDMPERRMFEATEASIIKEAPDMIVAHNAPYDLNELRNFGFDVGINRSRPLKEYVRDFYERLVIKGITIVDTLKISQAMFPQLGSHSLENFSTAVLGEKKGYEKDISHANIDELCAIADDSRLTSKERIEAAQKILKYGMGDTFALLDIINKSPIIDYYVQLANEFDLDYNTIINSPSSITKAFDRAYFDEVGTHRYPDYLQYLRLCEMEAFKTGFKKERVEILKELIPERNRKKKYLKGTQEGITKIQIPYSKYIFSTFFNQISGKIKEAKFLKEFYQKVTDEGEHKYRFFPLEMMKRFMSDILCDFYMYKRQSEKVQTIIRRGSFPKPEGGIYDSIIDSLCNIRPEEKDTKEKFKQKKNNLKKFYNKKLRDYERSVNNIENLEEKLQNLEKNKVGMTELDLFIEKTIVEKKILRQKNRKEKIYNELMKKVSYISGYEKSTPDQILTFAAAYSHKILLKSVFELRYGFHPDDVEKTLHNGYKKMKEELDIQGAEIIGYKGDWLFVKGELWRNDKLYTIDEQNMNVSPNLTHFRYNAIKGPRVNKESAAVKNTPLFKRTAYNCYRVLIEDNDLEGAIRIVASAAVDLAKGRIPLKDLIYKRNNNKELVLAKEEIKKLAKNIKKLKKEKSKGGLEDIFGTVESLLENKREVKARTYKKTWFVGITGHEYVDKKAVLDEKKVNYLWPAFIPDVKYYQNEFHKKVSKCFEGYIDVKDPIFKKLCLGKITAKEYLNTSAVQPELGLKF